MLTKKIGNLWMDKRAHRQHLMQHAGLGINILKQFVSKRGGEHVESHCSQNCDLSRHYEDFGEIRVDTPTLLAVRYVILRKLEYVTCK